jgi:hypothetical protein
METVARLSFVTTTTASVKNVNSLPGQDVVARKIISSPWKLA